MQQYPIPHTDLTVSRLAYGCMNIGGKWDRSPLTQAEKQAAVEVVVAAYEAGITLFDHADIYTHGKSEAVFAEVWPAVPGLRDNIVLQSKCGIRFKDDPRPGDPQRYDFSYEHITASVEGSLQRLQTEYLDILLLHRPDALVEPEEVARAFAALHSSGKVRYFGLSNHTAAQIELLRRFVDQPLVINQLELSLLHSPLINEGIMANQLGASGGLAGGILDYCRLHDILVQAWSPVASGQLFNPPADAPTHIQHTAQLVAQLAAAKQTSREAIILAWLLRHPAKIQPIIGTTKAERVQRSCQADTITLSREEWYALFTAARGQSVP
jgi:predicted oxidoreductase